jgi:hypothetical protein
MNGGWILFAVSKQLQGSPLLRGGSCIGGTLPMTTVVRRVSAQVSARSGAIAHHIRLSNGPGVSVVLPLGQESAAQVRNRAGLSHADLQPGAAGQEAEK